MLEGHVCIANELRKPLKIMIIGDANSLWVKSVIEYTHIPYGDHVTILTYTENILFKDYYKKYDIKVKTIRILRTAKGPLNLLYNVNLVLQPVDLIIVHFVTKNAALLACIGSIFKRKIILIFWGSDILRAKRSIIIDECCKKSSQIQISTKKMKEKFHEMYGKAYDNKIKMLNFGSKAIDLLGKNHNSDIIKNKYKISNNKIIIAIGHNKSTSQQHKKILDEIEKLPCVVKENIHIILRLTYGDADENYIREIRRCVDTIGCTSTFFESFLSDEQIAEITFITDVFVHAQTTDARSAAMCEHLYAGALVIVPQWLNYDIADKVFFLKYKDFNELGIILKDNIVKKSSNKFKEQRLANKKAIFELLSWKVQAPKWRELYYL